MKTLTQEEKVGHDRVGHPKPSSDRHSTHTGKSTNTHTLIPYISVGVCVYGGRVTKTLV